MSDNPQMKVKELCSQIRQRLVNIDVFDELSYAQAFNQTGGPKLIMDALANAERDAAAAAFDEGWSSAISDTMTDAEREVIRANGKGVLDRVRAEAREDALGVIEPAIQRGYDKWYEANCHESGRGCITEYIKLEVLKAIRVLAQPAEGTGREEEK